MSSPLQFYRSFKTLMDESGIRYVLTSGMACVEYGLQQTTKDTDWIIDPSSLPDLVTLLTELERGLTGKNWRISYRALFGAPLDKQFLASGWTSHLAIYDEPNSPEHHLDFFGQPPRLTTEAAFENALDGIANRLVIAQMKKTNRDKDWPMVESLSEQAAFLNEPLALLHSRDPDLLSTLWSSCSAEDKSHLLLRRPFLNLLESGDSPGLIRRSLLIERTFWEEVNKLRYQKFQHEWKEFLRRWRKQDDFAWPVSNTFVRQHQLISQAVQDFGLTCDPLLGTSGRKAIYDQASDNVAELFELKHEKLSGIVPPIAEILP